MQGTHNLKRSIRHVDDMGKAASDGLRRHYTEKLPARGYAGTQRPVARWTAALACFGRDTWRVAQRHFGRLGVARRWTDSHRDVRSEDGCALRVSQHRR